MFLLSLIVKYYVIFLWSFVYCITLLIYIFNSSSLRIISVIPSIFMHDARLTHFPTVHTYRTDFTIWELSTLASPAFESSLSFVRTRTYFLALVESHAHEIEHDNDNEMEKQVD